MLDLAALRQLVEGLDYPARFVTVSGAHLYGFPSSDSDIDLRGCHQVPLEDAVGLSMPEETLERKALHAGSPVELVSHEVRKYLSLLLKSNGYVLEQIFSPLVVAGQEFLDDLRPLAQRCITRHHYHHYRGFLAAQRRLLENEEPKRLKTVLYAYRVLLTGIHLLRTGEVQANLPTLCELYVQPFLKDLMARKVAEGALAADLDWSFHDAKLRELEAELDRAANESPLPLDRDRAAVNQFLVQLRLSRWP